jgi:ATP-dependent RNA helicase DDX24/MAK5
MRFCFIILQRARIKVLESFRIATGNVVVVATDVAARGLDIPSVSTVVHYDAARKVDTFVHRSGRTAVSIVLFVKFCRVWR